MRKYYNRRKYNDSGKSHPKLFQYTDYDVLYYILQNNSIRLSRIDKVRNDPQEANRLKGDWYKKYYVACFTNKVNEDIYFWSEYGSSKESVDKIRIAFKNDFVNSDMLYYKNNEEKFLKVQYKIKNYGMSTEIKLLLNFLIFMIYSIMII